MNEEVKGQQRMGLLMQALAWIVFMALVGLYFSDLLERQHNPNQSVETRYLDAGVREVILKRSRSGHYITSGTINGEPVTFMLDTGATGIAIPAAVARRLGLARGRRLIIQTANGTASAYATRLQHVGVGEIGLDFYDKGADREAQLAMFEGQLAIAREHGLPVILHVRKAHDEVLGLLHSAGVRGGIAHAFNGSRQQAGKYIEMGFKLGFGGMLTFERSRKLRELARGLPLDALVLETDAPDMTVSRFRGQRNSPEYIPLVLEAMASVRPEAADRIAAATTRNAVEVLGLPMALDQGISAA